VIALGLDGFRYRFTRDDWDLMCRALVGEAGDRAWQGRDGATICWCMLQRLWLLRDTTYRGRDGVLETPPHTYRGLATLPPEVVVTGGLVEDYSQPVNPFWTERGTPERQARRRRIRLGPLDDVAPPQTRALVARFMAGFIQMLPEELGIVHFTAPTMEPRGTMRRRTVPNTRSSNVWYTTAQSRTWRRPVVWIAAPTTGDLLAYGAGALL
jgi:hypothetical protein